MKSSKFFRRLGLLLVLLFLFMLALTVIYPFLWMIISSFKDNTELYLSPWSLPGEWRWGNFACAWNAGIGNYFLNSLFVTSVSTVFSILFSAMAAYPLSRYRFRLRKTCLVFLICGLMLAPQVALIPLYKLLQLLGLYNTYWAMIVPYVAYRIPFTAFLFWSHMLTLPKEIEDSARIDGCGFLGVFWNVVLPLSKPILFTGVLLAVRTIWNEFMFALVFTESSRISTIPLGLMALKGDTFSSYPTLIAGLLITCLPMIILFLALQKQFVRGLTEGGVKG